MQTLTAKLKFIESVFGSGFLAANGKNFGVRCPICAPRDMSKKKLVIRVDDDLTHCWTCGYGACSLAPLIKKYGSQDNLVRYRDEFMPEMAKSRWRTNDAEPEKLPDELKLPEQFTLLTTAHMNNPDVLAAWNYLKSRNVTRKDAWFFKLGISNELRWKRRIIIPSFDVEGKLNYFVARNIDPFDRRPKYDGPDVLKSKIIFNEINVDWSSRLVIVEGAFDLMKCPENTVPLLGSDLSEKSELFSKILVNDTKVSIALDGDMWDVKVPKLSKKLKEYDVDHNIVDLRQHGDPGKMTKAAFRESLDSAVTLDWNDRFFSKLNRASTMSLRMRSDTYRSEHAQKITDRNH